MQQQTLVQGEPPAVQALLTLSGKLTIGAAVCFSEGVFTSVMAMMTTSIAFYQASVVLAFMIWAAFFLRFRGTRIGAEITGLCFIELCVRLTDLARFLDGQDPRAMWYVVTSISILKIMRVYLWQRSLTQQYGWGQQGLFGFVTAQKSAGRWQATPWRKVALEFAVLLAVAILISIGIKLLSPLGRVLLMWLVPFAFEFILGPIQLASLAKFAPAFLSENQRDAAQATEIANLKKALAAAQQAQGTPPDPDLTALIASYASTTPERRAHITFYAQNVAEQFPAGQPEPDA